MYNLELCNNGINNNIKISELDTKEFLCAVNVNSVNSINSINNANNINNIDSLNSNFIKCQKHRNYNTVSKKPILKKQIYNNMNSKKIKKKR
jgi:hypothetical protein